MPPADGADGSRETETEPRGRASDPPEGGSDDRPTLRAFWHDDCLAHEPAPGEFEAPWTGRLAHREPHPDRRERIENVRSIIDAELAGVATVDWRTAPLATREQLARVHDPAYLDDLRAFAAAGGGELTPTTRGNEATWDAARRAAGGAAAAAESALASDADAAYACVRPSGHHAGPAVADGYCFLNNVAVAAEAALASPGVDRVAVLDWDVHHGNGTATCFADHADVLVVSLHNDHGSWDPVTHPETGDVDEHGERAGEGYTVNVPLPPGVGDEGYAYLFDRLVEPVVRAYDPDLLVASAGGDAGVLDPLGRNLLTVRGFADLGRRTRALAVGHADGALAVVQEGGYQVSHLAYAMLATLEGTLGVETGVRDPLDWIEEDADRLRPALDEVVEAHAEYWPVE